MSEKKSLGKVFFNGIIPENPTFRLVLGTCPTLAVTSSACWARFPAPSAK